VFRTALWTVVFASLMAGCVDRCMAAEANASGYSFTTAPFVPPRIIGDLSTWLSDGGDQVIAVNLTDAVGSNRYFGEVKSSQGASGENPYVFTDRDCADSAAASCANSGRPSFGYRMAGRAANGIFVLFTEENGGGSGRFRNLMFVTVEKDRGLNYDESNGILRLSRERWLIKKLGEVPLGDRYVGKITVTGNSVHIEADRHDPSTQVVERDKVIRLDLSPK